MERTDYIHIGSNTYDGCDVYLIRDGHYITLKYIYEETYDVMDDYIRDRVDFLSERREAVSDGQTEQSYDDWVANYEYQYSDYFNYDGILDIYYDENGDYYKCDDFYCGNGAEKEEMIDRIMQTFEDDYNDSHLDWNGGMTLATLRNKVAQFFDDCQAYEKARAEASKPHRNAFSYYK